MSATEADLERRLSAVDEAIQQAKDLQGLLSSLRYDLWNDLMAVRSRAATSAPRDHYADELARDVAQGRAEDFRRPGDAA